MNRLKDFLDNYGPDLARRIENQLAVVHDPLRDSEPDMDRQLCRMKKKPFAVQAEVVKAAVKAFAQAKRCVYLAAEMGSGKTLMGIATALLLKPDPRVLVICPPHLVRKWIGEIASCLPGCKAVNLNGKNCQQLLQGLTKAPSQRGPEFYVIGREKAKIGYRWRPAVIRSKEGIFCPRCGGALVDEDLMPLEVFGTNGQGKVKRKFTCPNTIPRWRCDAEGQPELVHVPCNEPLWQADGDGPRKYMPALFIKKRLRGFFDLLIADECHQFKNLSGQGYAFGALSGACDYTLALTGTLMGGYASDLFYLLYRTDAKAMLEDGNSWGNPMGFMTKYGVLERVTIIPEEDGQTVKSKKRTIVKAKPGVSPLLIGNMLLSNAVFLRLSDMAENLPDYSETVVELAMDPEQEEAYRAFEDQMKQALQSALATGDYSLLGAYLNALLSYPERIYQGLSVHHPRTGELVAAGPAVSGNMPKEDELMGIIADETARGRRVLVYIQNSNTTDISPRLAGRIESAGYRVKVLKAGNTEGRAEKIEAWVKGGIDVMICNPKLVETGLDLLGFPTVVFYQCGYSIYTLRQASRRSWRITQKEPVQVYYLTYAGTMQTRAMKLIASKLETSLAIEGELTDKGLAALAETSDSMTKQLAKALLEQADDGESLKDVWTAFRKKELEMEGHGGGSGPVPVNPGPPAPGVEKKQVEVEQIGDRVLKVAFTKFIGRKKTTTEIEVKQGELDQMMKGKTGGAQLLLF